MLATLRIENLAIVESLEVDFGTGLTVITGETGAGKSILVRALKLVLGARAQPDLVRTGAPSATVEALFHIGDAPRVRERLLALDLPADDELLVRRTIQNGRSRGTVNGRLTTASQLRGLAQGLVDISSQHEHHTLADPANHLATLDAWAQAPGLLTRVAETYRAALVARDALNDLRARAAEQGERVDVLRFQASELARLAPQPGEIATLEEAVRRGHHAERLRSTTAQAEFALYSRDRAVCAELLQLEDALADAVAVAPELGPMVEQLRTARTELEDAAEALGRFSRTVDADPELLTHQEERLHELKRLARRFGGDLAAAIDRGRAIEEELAVLEAADDHIERLGIEASQALAVAGAAATELSGARHQAAAALGQTISRELADLGMGGARIEVDVAPLEGAAAELSHEGARLTARGIDRAEFLIAPNPGEEPRPLGRIASGGELSRALLATKRVLAGLGPVGTYVFDEVDTGVGGGVADAIGRKLLEVAGHHQVLCITHSPQIAALGRHHFRVQKRVEHGRTHSGLVPLHEGARVEELARMLGGRQITDAARDAARALLTPAA